MKSKTVLIIEALKSGKDFSLSEMADYLSEKTGQQVKNTAVSPVLSRLSRADETEIGYFIQRRKKPKTPYRFKLVDETLEMETEELIGLSRKSGKNRFTLEHALEKYPRIKKYVKSSMVKKAKEVNENWTDNANDVEDKCLASNEPESAELDFNEAVRKILENGITIHVNVNVRI